ncbi:MAG: hypothetical protein IT177_07180 [Acidobacteria bacterium]|nr:hypothetical protein [Acidobacteriota bacterium]
MSELRSSLPPDLSSEAVPRARRSAASLASAFARGWRQFWKGYWQAPIAC